MRRLLILASAIVLVDTMFYSAITPLLPFYAGKFGMSKSASGALAAAYPAGTLLLALPSGFIAARFGVRRTVVAGLSLMAASSLVFGFAESAWLLSSARFVQGFGGALSWAGSLGWLVTAAPRDRRAEMIGTAFGAALGGQLLGPVLGATARAAGTGPVLSAVAVLGVALIVVALGTPVARAGDAATASARAVLEPLRDRRGAAGAGLVVMVGLFFGVIEVLVPLRLDTLGSSAAVIAGAFLVTAGLQAVTSPLLGRWVDGGHALRTVAAGLASGAVLAAALPWPDGSWPIVALVLLMGPAVGVLWIPGMAMLSDGTERRGIEQAYAFALVNLTWAAAALAGNSGGSALAEATSDTVVYLALAALFAAVLALAAGLQQRTRIGSPPQDSAA